MPTDTGKSFYFSGPMTGQSQAAALYVNQTTRLVRIDGWNCPGALLLRKPFPGQLHIKAPSAGMH
jgi:hypothetical protein